MINLWEGGIADLWREEKSPEVLAISYAFQNAVKLIIKKALQSMCYADIDNVPEEILDVMAIEMRSMYYSNDLPIKTKRSIVKNTLKWYQKAGTAAAVEELVSTVFGIGEVSEWFDDPESGLVPGEFDIVSDAPITEDLIAQFNGIIATAKNVRSHLRYIRIEREVHQNLYTGMATDQIVVPEAIYNGLILRRTINGVMMAGIGLRSIKKSEIYETKRKGVI